MREIHDHKSLKEKRRALRQNLTPAEATLWKLLKNKQLMGRRFRRQHSIGPYITDFYCAQERLVIELDGEIHKGQVDYDQERTAYLEALGFRVIRFENSAVFHAQEGVLDAIAACFSTQ